MQEAIREKEIRMRSVEAAASVANPGDDIGNLLTHADWIASYVSKGKMPEVESVESTVAGRIEIPT